MLWFLSLVLSLTPALLGIFVKQWLREYMSWTRISPPDVALQRRAFRHDAFVQWKVGEIVTTLPALLQLSLVLFFIGLAVLLHTLDRSVEIAVAVMVGLTLGCVAVFIVLPATRRACPYKSPLAWAFLRSCVFVQDLLRRCNTFVHAQRKTCATFVRDVCYWCSLRFYYACNRCAPYVAPVIDWCAPHIAAIRNLCGQYVVSIRDFYNRHVRSACTNNQSSSPNPTNPVTPELDRRSSFVGDSHRQPNKPPAQITGVRNGHDVSTDKQSKKNSLVLPPQMPQPPTDPECVQVGPAVDESGKATSHNYAQSTDFTETQHASASRCDGAPESRNPQGAAENSTQARDIHANEADADGAIGDSLSLRHERIDDGKEEWQEGAHGNVLKLTTEHRSLRPMSPERVSVVIYSLEEDAMEKGETTERRSARRRFFPAMPKHGSAVRGWLKSFKLPRSVRQWYKVWLGRISTKWKSTKSRFIRLAKRPKATDSKPKVLKEFIQLSHIETRPDSSMGAVMLEVHIRPKGLGRTWDRRDSEAQFVVSGPIHDVAWKCRSLLWAAAHENLDSSFLLRAIRELRCSMVAFEKPATDSTLFGGEDNPHKRLCAYWLAIAQHLKYQTTGTLELNNHVWQIFKYSAKNEHDFYNMDKFTEKWKPLHHQLAKLDPMERMAIFQLLISGVHATIDWLSADLVRQEWEQLDTKMPIVQAPFTQETIDSLYIVTVHMLRILCHRRSSLHSKYIYLLLRMLLHRDILPWPYEHRINPTVTCVAFLNDALANVTTVGEFLLSFSLRHLS
jgi:hypothetical protein